MNDAWRTFRDRISGVGLGETTSAGWTVKEMLAHVAFWLETVPPFVTGTYRGDPSAFEMTFPSGYRPEGEWPPADVHNAREAAWAREQPDDVVVARAERAYEELCAFLETVDDEEAAANAEVFAGNVTDHLAEHTAELG